MAFKLTLCVIITTRWYTIYKLYLHYAQIIWNKDLILKKKVSWVNGHLSYNNQR